MVNWTAEFSYWNCWDCAVLYNSFFFFHTILPFPVPHFGLLSGLDCFCVEGGRIGGNHNGSLVNMLH